jgi:hypothetical protein
VDGYRLTRRQRLRTYTEKTALVVGPSVVLALVALALGLWVDALVVVAIAGITAIALGSAVRTRVGAAVMGVVLAAGIFLIMLAISWIASHPIQRGD